MAYILLFVFTSDNSLPNLLLLVDATEFGHETAPQLQETIEADVGIHSSKGTTSTKGMSHGIEPHITSKTPIVHATTEAGDEMDTSKRTTSTKGEREEETEKDETTVSANQTNVTEHAGQKEIGTSIGPVNFQNFSRKDFWSKIWQTSNSTNMERMGFTLPYINLEATT
ncbi:hypothetical protein HHI36_001134 [Cryptolaemus montrouzieri]|uniref:Uncharacterized protein n=1 Tax=Cryptolaemus montrouzieri TaxID=559131 RepID=A0ABD2P6X5_9CUCU